jgi:mono/diheme cytochrome c family protein
MKMDWRGTFSLVGGGMVAAGIAWLISGCASTHTLAVQEANYPKDKVDARSLFVENCATCHGKNGRARTFHGWILGAQNLTDPKFQAEISDPEIIHAIETGPKAMPAFGKKLSESEIEALASYVRTLKVAE